MALVRRHWKLVVCQFVLLVSAIVAGAYYLAHRPERAAAATSVPDGSQQQSSSPGPTATDPLMYSRVQELRQRLCLGDTDLAAAGLTQAQASSVLSSLKSWYASNASAWDADQQALDAATRNLQEAWRKVNLGPRDEALLSQLPSLQQSRDNADAAKAQLLDSAAAGVSGILNAAQAAAWATARANAAAPDRYRYATGLTADQAAALTLVLAKQGNDPAAVAAAEQRVLTAGQVAAMRAAAQNASQAADGVSAADASTLAPPASVVAQ